MSTMDMFSRQSPEELLEKEQERRPREYAKEIFTGYERGERMLQVDRVVPVRLRNTVRQYLRDFEEREEKHCLHRPTKPGAQP